MTILQSRGERAFIVFAWIVMSLITILTFLPFLLMFIASFTDESSLVKNGYSFFPGSLNVDAYIYIFSNAVTFVRAYGVSFFVTIVGTGVGLMLTAMLAYPMARRDFKYHNVLAFIVFFTLLFNGGIVPSYMLWSRMLHVNNTLFALILPNFLLNGFNVLLVRNYYMSNVPVELIESAKMDGAGEIKIFFRIMFPLSIPVVATVGFFIGLMYWNDWINALYYISNPNYYGIQNLLIELMNHIEYLNSSQASNLLGANAVKLPTTAARMAMGIIGILPILIAFPFFQKYLTKGIIIGAIKG